MKDFHFVLHLERNLTNNYVIMLAKLLKKNPLTSYLSTAAAFI